jgi:multidrug efflux pump subunit AcrB
MRVGLAGRLAHAFIDSKLTPLFIAAALGLGALALLSTPREEEPQIRVPMVDVAVPYPGADPDEVETRVLDPVERAMWGIGRVEHVYGVARPGFALVTVRFRVGEPEEESLVRVQERLSGLARALPAGAGQPTVELHSIDEVPFLTLTLWSERLDSDGLRPLAAELAQELAQITEISRPAIIGGQPRVVRVEPDPDRMAAAGVTWTGLARALESSAARQAAGTAVRDNRETRIEAGPLLASGKDVASLVVALRAGAPVYVRDVARIVDGPDEARDVVLFSPGRGSGRAGLVPGSEHPAVTLTLAKRPGANATALSEQVRAKVESLRPRLMPADVHVEITRDYGRTAEEKSDELVRHLLIATLSVVVLIGLAMGWRSGLVVGVAVPVTLSLTLFIYYLLGYTLNRVTLFALVFSIGILVDDAIVVVENIERHHRQGRGHSFLRTAIEAVDEVGNPTILATFTVIAAILPMAFVRGLMGPYMRPIPTGASAAMLFSLAVAFVVSPWAAARLFGSGREGDRRAAPAADGWTTRIYRRAMSALLRRPAVRWSFFAAMAAALAGAVGLVALGAVRVKMLPFDNKSELQVLVDHDEDAPLERTLQTAREMSRWLTAQPEVKDVEIYAGAAAPVNFNGLVRHYFLRRSPSGADLQVNFVSKHDRREQSHDLAKRLRGGLQEIARRRGSRVKVVEIPPGPPVLDTLVAEVYGPTAAQREGLAATIRGLFETTEGVVDVDDSLEAARSRTVLALDTEKTALHGIVPAQAIETLAGSGAGRDVARIEAPHSREPVPVRLQLGAADRAGLARRTALRVETSTGAQVSLSAVTRAVSEPEPQPILHKDLKPVVYVFGDVAGARESPVYALGELNKKIDALRLPGGGRVERYAVEAPETSDRPALKWDGEWQITYEVFRDLGVAFAVVLVLIAILVIGWFQSFAVPVAILLPIPLSLVGILPGHWLFGAFFTATSMIGFIAGAGIIVRNSIILVDFIELKLRQGAALEEAVVEAGAVRFRPMLLTAAAVVVGSFVILFDPIFQGLALSLMMGEVAATLLSRMAVPVVYYLLARGGRAESLRRQGLTPEAAA